MNLDFEGICLLLLKKFLTVWGTAAPGCPRHFHALWVGRRSMTDH
jgi:hypothetical protein